MHRHFSHIIMWMISIFLVSATITPGNTFAKEILHLYGPGGPYPAIQKAAEIFGKKLDVKLAVVTGPTDQWIEKARSDADLIYSGSEYMMTDTIRALEGEIDKTSVTSLYLRPSAILVRHDNPKEVQDFPDLLEPGIKVLVVSGAGQTGLWEDVAGKQGDIETVRKFRKNIFAHASNGAEAKKLWNENRVIDAWLTWNIWAISNPTMADLVPMSEDYVIYRGCGIALTIRGKEKRIASSFIEFLQSDEGAGIFAKWGWITVSNEKIPITVQDNIRVVYQIKDDEWEEGVGKGLIYVKRLLDAYESMEIPVDEVYISAVFHGKAGYWMLRDAPYGSFTGKGKENPNKIIIQELIAAGVSIELCARTMKRHEWSPEDILPEVSIVAGAYPRIIDLQLQGYAYIRF